MSVSLKKYWADLDDVEKSEIIKKRFGNGTVSKLEKSVGISLLDISIPFETQFRIAGKSFDYFLTDSNILIEINGDFWHANPQIYKCDDLIPFPGLERKASDVWLNEEKKIELAESNGYSVLVIWESEIKKLNHVQLGEFLLERIKQCLELQ